MTSQSQTEALKQQSLPFTSRRSAATSGAKPKGSKLPDTIPPTLAQSQFEESSAVEVEDDEEAVPRRGKTRAAKLRAAEEDKRTNKKRKHGEDEPSSSKSKGKQTEERAKRIFRSRVSIENVEGRTPTREQDASSDVEPDSPANLDTSEKAKKQRILRHYGEVRQKMGYLKPIHALKDQKKEYHILRVFDLSYEYGPCIGMSRLQRWERAEALGLNPPVAVKDILLAEQSKEGSTMAECVFYDEV